MVFYGCGKCAANLATALGLQCTADFQMDNHANCSFSFPFCQRFATERSRQYSRSEPMRCLVFQATKPQEPQKCPNSRFRHPRGVITHERILKRPEIISELQRETYGLARPSVHTCIVFFQTFGALGLPMCHMFQVSGSSLPVPIFIGRRFDQIILQAEVMESGMKVFPHMVGHEWQRLISGNFIQSV